LPTNRNFWIPPAVDGRIVFADTEFTTLVDQQRELWEGALIIRDPGEPDREFAWQVRPDLTFAARDSLRIGRYYRRSRLIGHGVGVGVVITADEQWQLLSPEDDVETDRLTTGAAIAAQVAAALDGATIVAAVASADELCFDRWLSANGQRLTSHYRLKCIETLAQGYLLGWSRGLLAAERDELRALLVPPFDPRPMYEQIGVPLLDRDQAHNALYDCRQVRDVWNAVYA
jgi:hypothetical protein